MASESNQPNREELLQMAIRAAKTNNKDGARVMFRRVLSEDKRNERAMMWLAKLANSDKEQRQWLNRVLSVNPDNNVARGKLAEMDYKAAAQKNRSMLYIGTGVGAVVIVVGSIFLMLILNS